MMKQMACSNCGGAGQKVRGSHQFIESGLNNVVLQGIEIFKCKVCGNEDPIIPRMNDLIRTIAVAVVAKPRRLSGEEIRFLRKYLEMTGDRFSRLLHVDKTTLSKWENNDDQVGAQSDLAIRMITLALGDGLKEKVEEIVKDFDRIQFKSGSKKISKRQLKSQTKTCIEVDPETLEYEYA